MQLKNTTDKQSRLLTLLLLIIEAYNLLNLMTNVKYIMISNAKLMQMAYEGGGYNDMHWPGVWSCWYQQLWDIALKYFKARWAHIITR